MTACLSLVPFSTPVIWSYPAVAMAPGVCRLACHVHVRSSTVIGDPSSQTAFGSRSTVMVIFVAPVGTVSPVAGVVEPGAVVAPPAAAGVVVAPAAVVSGAAVVALPSVV